MSSRNRGIVTDYAGEEIYRGDLIAYSARHKNAVRLADAEVLAVETRRVAVEGVGTICIPVLKIRPTGAESGDSARRTMRDEWIIARHVRLVERGEGR
ncbi:hypothetical protein [Streptomyces malaysiensis]